jgi:hypothetical protein
MRTRGDCCGLEVNPLLHTSIELRTRRLISCYTDRATFCELLCQNFSYPQYHIIKRGEAVESPGYQGRHRVKRGFGSSCTAAIGSPRCSSAKWPSSLFARRSEHLRSTLALLPRARASWDSSPHLAARSLTGFDAAGGQRKSLPPVCWVGSQPQRAVRHRLYDSAGSARCWNSSTARPLLKLPSECLHHSGRSGE